MFLENWQIIFLAVATGVWAEFRNIQGKTEGYINGVSKLLVELQVKKIIVINECGTIVKCIK